MGDKTKLRLKLPSWWANPAEAARQVTHATSLTSSSDACRYFPHQKCFLDLETDAQLCTASHSHDFWATFQTDHHITTVNTWRHHKTVSFSPLTRPRVTARVSRSDVSRNTQSKTGTPQSRWLWVYHTFAVNDCDFYLSRKWNVTWDAVANETARGRKTQQTLQTLWSQDIFSAFIPPLSWLKVIWSSITSLSMCMVCVLLWYLDKLHAFGIVLFLNNASHTN